MQIELTPLQLRLLEQATPTRAREIMRHCLDNAAILVEGAITTPHPLPFLRNAARQMELAIVWRDRWAYLQATEDLKDPTIRAQVSAQVDQAFAEDARRFPR